MQEWIGRVVEPTALSDNEMEWAVNSGMRMRITDIAYVDDDCYKIDVDLSEFVEYNKDFLQYNFYDKHGIPGLNVYEAGYIGPDHKDVLYIGEGTFEQILKIIEE